MTNDAWNVIANLDFSTYEQTIAKLRQDFIYIQKFKMPLASVHELNHIGCECYNDIYQEDTFV